NSGIPNHAFYLAATAIGGNGWDEAGHVWYAALQQLGADSQFKDCARITTQVAAANYGTESAVHKAVKDAWNQVGLPVDVPTPVIRTKVDRTEKVDYNGTSSKRHLEQLLEELRKTIETMK